MHKCVDCNPNPRKITLIIFFSADQAKKTKYASSLKEIGEKYKYNKNHYNKDRVQKKSQRQKIMIYNLNSMKTELQPNEQTKTKTPNKIQLFIRSSSIHAFAIFQIFD